ncbi:hypothetical protein FIBSPDRAFT_860464, partial [Athelia psychrophila]
MIEADNDKQAGGVHTCGDHDSSTHNLRVRSARHAQRLRDTLEFLQGGFYLNVSDPCCSSTIHNIHFHPHHYITAKCHTTLQILDPRIATTHGWTHGTTLSEPLRQSSLSSRRSRI